MCAQVRSGATDHSSVTPHQTAKPASRPTPIQTSTGARRASVRVSSRPIAAPTPTNAMPICSRGSSGSPTAPCAKTAYAQTAVSASSSAAADHRVRTGGAGTSTGVATRETTWLAGVVTAMGNGGRC